MGACTGTGMALSGRSTTFVADAGLSGRAGLLITEPPPARGDGRGDGAADMGPPTPPPVASGAGLAGIGRSAGRPNAAGLGSALAAEDDAVTPVTGSAEVGREIDAGGAKISGAETAAAAEAATGKAGCASGCCCADGEAGGGTPANDMVLSARGMPMRTGIGLGAVGAPDARIGGGCEASGAAIEIGGCCSGRGCGGSGCC